MTNSLLRFLLLGSFLFLFSSVASAQASFIYTLNDLSTGNSISAFSVDPTGVLTEIPGSPYFTGESGFGGGLPASNRIAVVGGFLYAANGLSARISAYSINQTTGSLTPVPGSPFPSEIGVQGVSLAPTPDGRFLFASFQSSDKVVTYSISSNGALTRVSTFTLFSNSETAGSKVSPDGRFLAVTVLNVVPGVIEMFAIQPDGSLMRAPGSPFADGTPDFSGIATSVDFNCKSNLLFVGEGTGLSTIVSVFNVASSGALTPISGTPFRPGVGINSGVVSLSPDGQFLFVSNQGSNSITVFRVSSNGSLSLVAGSPFPTGVNVPDATPGGMTVNKSGTLLFTAVIPNYVAVSRINNDGTLTSVPGSPATTNQPFGAFSLAIYPSTNCIEAAQFDRCLQDENNGNQFQLNLATGEYRFTNCNGLVVTGTGVLIKKGNIVSLQHYASDRRVLAKIDLSANTGYATIQLLSNGTTLTIIDRNTGNNMCSCL